MYFSQLCIFLFSINADRLDQIAESASELFKSIQKNTFYCRGSKNSNAQGSLQTVIDYQREKAIAIGLTPPIRNKRKQTEGNKS